MLAKPPRPKEDAKVEIKNQQKSVAKLNLNFKKIFQKIKLFLRQKIGLIAGFIILVILASFLAYNFGQKSGVNNQKKDDQKIIQNLKKHLSTQYILYEKKDSEVKQIEDYFLGNARFSSSFVRKLEYDKKEYYVIVDPTSFEDNPGVSVLSVSRQYVKQDKKVLNAILKDLLDIDESTSNSVKVSKILDFIREEEGLSYIREVDYDNLVYKEEGFQPYQDQFYGPKYDHVQNPEETIAKGGGDCEDFSILAYFLMREVGLDVSLVTTQTHVFLGIADDYYGDYVSLLGKKYFLVEITSKSFDVGDFWTEDFDQSELENAEIFTFDEKGDLIYETNIKYGYSIYSDQRNIDLAIDKARIFAQDIDVSSPEHYASVIVGFLESELSRSETDYEVMVVDNMMFIGVPGNYEGFYFENEGVKYFVIDVFESFEVGEMVQEYQDNFKID